MLTTYFSYMPKRVSDERLRWPVDRLLTMQNPGGGYASYEVIRGPQWMELLNPAEVFGELEHTPPFVNVSSHSHQETSWSNTATLSARPPS